MRINKYLAKCELGSRRGVENLIKLGKISVNGEIVTDLSVIVNPETDIVVFENKVVKPVNKTIYVMINKPKGYLSSTKDQFNKLSVLKLLSNIDNKIYPIGRLDYNTTGLLLLTNDGDITNKIIAPQHGIEKEYVVEFKGRLTNDILNTLTSPMNIDGYIINPAKISNVIENNKLKTTTLNIIINEGRNRQIRKMFEQVGLKIVSLHRIRIGGLWLENLKIGEHKILTENEINKVFK